MSVERCHVIHDMGAPSGRPVGHLLRPRPVVAWPDACQVVLPALLRGGALLRDEPRGEQAHGREGHRRAHDGQRNRDGASLRAR